MTRERKSPQQKKDLELERDHFTFAKNPHAFRKAWKQKKALINREYRRKSEELLDQAKPEMSGDDVDLMAGDITAALLQRGVSRKRLHKSSTVKLGEKIKIKLEKREETIGRRADNRRRSDAIVNKAVQTLNSLEGQQLIGVVKRIAFCFKVEIRSNGCACIALQIPLIEQSGLWSGCTEAMASTLMHYGGTRSYQKLCAIFQRWKTKANRILAKQKRPAERKLEQKIATEKRLKAVQRQARGTEN